MKLFLDACIIIYLVEAAEPFYTRVVEAIRNSTPDVSPMLYAVSRLSFLECRVKPLRDHDKHSLDKLDEYFQAPDLTIVELTPEVINQATILRARFGLRTPDAIQAACALSLVETTRFLTGDSSFRKVTGFDVLVI